MSDNEIYPSDPQDSAELIDLDDVEGHGLKEVAAGLGAAAVLAGGAAGVTQLTGSSATVHASKAPVVQVQVSDPVGTTMDAADRSIAGAQSLRDGALDTADARIDKAETAVRNLPSDLNKAIGATTDLAGDTIAWAGDVKSAATQTAKATVKGTTASATTTAGNATSFAVDAAHATTQTATTAVDKKVDRATTTASSTTSNVDRKAATVLSVVTTTAADGVHTAKVTLKAVDAGAGVNSGSAGGWVLVKAGDQVLAQVQMVGGEATASWTMPLVGGHSVTVSYTGDNAFAPSLRAIAL